MELSQIQKPKKIPNKENLEVLVTFLHGLSGPVGCWLVSA